MKPLDGNVSAASPAVTRSELALGVIAGSCTLAILYFARAVLIPIALAMILSLAIAPVVRLLRRLRLGHVGAVLVAASALAAVAVVLVSIVAVQLAHAATELPRYEQALLVKMQQIRTRVDALVPLPGAVFRMTPVAPIGPKDVGTSTQGVLQGGSLSIASNPFSALWPTLQSAGIVLIVLLFVMLEYEAIRNRFIRLVGVTDMRTTTAAINDAGERLSRFLISQLAVNVAVGSVSGIGLALMGFPHAPLWGVLTLLLRFVPYVGVLTAALSAVLLAAAVEPGWSLALMTLCLYVVIYVVAAQVVEPHLYGHMTGMSPLSVVVAALFWGWLWGPVGLVVSTPITLCLVVAGHHVLSLRFVNILLGDGPGLTLSQRFYQRALSGDSHEIIEAARSVLKRLSLASYGDTVLMPALRMSLEDLKSGELSTEQLQKVRRTAVDIVDTFGTGAVRRLRGRHKRNSVLDDPNPGRHLRHLRELELGQFQGRFDVAAGSVVVCVGLGYVGDDLATEILVRILRDLHVDARHLSIEEVFEPMPEGASPSLVSMVCVVSFSLEKDAEGRATTVSAQARTRFGDASLIALQFEVRESVLEPPNDQAIFDRVTHSIEETAQIALATVKAARPTIPAR